MRSRAKPRVAKTQALRRRLVRLGLALAATRQRHARELAALRRAADRQLARTVAEIAALRHHQARAEALTRLLEERDRVLAAQSERIARLEGLLQTPTELG